MLNFSHKKHMSLLVLFALSLNSFADTRQHDKASLSKKSAPNLVELYKVKLHATEHIKGIEAKLSATNEADQEELLVELAQSLLYYQERHTKASDAKAAASKGASSLSANGANGKVSKTISSKGPYSTNKIYSKALNAYKKASKLSLNKNRINYTRELSELAVKLQNKNELVQVFDEILQYGGDEKGTYLAHIDYADGLAKFKDNAAEIQFLSAVNMRTPVGGVEANFRYANYLLKNNKPRKAFGLLEKFTFEERRMYVHIALLRQKTIHILKLDTKEVDAEMQQIRKNLSNTPFIGSIPKFTRLVKNTPTNFLNLLSADAFAFAHQNISDDSRGEFSQFKKPTPLYFNFSVLLINAAEVIYNEARGRRQKVKYAIGWAIRNRATINMNGCDSYPGAEGHFNVDECRAETPDGPPLDNTDVYKRYSCVVHGGTTSVGSSHSEMNDAHVSIENLESSGILWEMLYIMNGWITDPSGPRLFLTGIYPNKDLSTGNPNGTQEWKKMNYCAKNHFCKVRLGNIDGNFSDHGDFCPRNGGYNTDIFFWGRQAEFLDINITR